jgi:hypothetical protein
MFMLADGIAKKVFRTPYQMIPEITKFRNYLSGKR